MTRAPSPIHVLFDHSAMIFIAPIGLWECLGCGAGGWWWRKTVDGIDTSVSIRHRGRCPHSLDARYA